LFVLGKMWYPIIGHKFDILIQFIYIELFL